MKAIFRGWYLAFSCAFEDFRLLVRCNIICSPILSWFDCWWWSTAQLLIPLEEAFCFFQEDRPLDYWWDYMTTPFTYLMVLISSEEVTSFFMEVTLHQHSPPPPSLFFSIWGKRMRETEDHRLGYTSYGFNTKVV